MKTKVLQSAFALALVAGFSQIASAVTFNITPSAVSNTYDGTITLQVSGLTSGDTVVVQDFLDLNTNGVIDSTDMLAQQFNLTDGQAGMVIGGVTNINVPGDTDTTAGQITATVNFVSGGSGPIAGQYIIRVSSPAAHFAPLTQLFTITNVPYPQKIAGKVVSDGTNVPNAVVVLFPPSSGNQNGPGNPVAWAVADDTGGFSIPVPVGTYVPLAFKYNYVANYGSSPVVALGSSQTIDTNLTLTNATTSISGSLVDVGNPSIGLPGIFLPTTAKDGLLAVGFTDTNGSFNIPVRADHWGLDGEPAGLAIHGYVGYQGKTNIDTTGGSVSGLILGFSKATALFYGSVKDSLGNPIPGVNLFAGDNNNEYGQNIHTDPNGNFALGALGGLSGDSWSVQIDNNQSGNVTNYDFSSGVNGVTIAADQAYQYNFTAVLATNRITGNVQYNGSPVSGVQVYASATIGTNSFQTQADTDTNGNYTLNVASGTWNVNVYDCGCSDNNSLNNVITGSYLDPGSQNVNISGNNGVANFTVLTNNGSGQIFGYVKDTGNVPVTNLTVYIGDGVGHIYATNTDSAGYYSFFVASGGWGVTLDCGQLNSLGYQCVGTNFVNVTANSVEEDFTVQPNVSQPLQITTTSLPVGTNGLFYGQMLQASGGMPPYNWFIPNYSVPPPNLTLTSDGTLSGTPMTNGKFYFDVVVTDALSNTVELDGLALTILNNPPLPPVVITNTSLPGATVGVSYNTQLDATGGQSPYTWSLALGSANPPPGLTLSSSGLISGTPTVGGTYYFQVQAADAYSSTGNKVLSIAVSATVVKPVISSPARLSGGQFQMLLNGVANQNYTVQMSTNLDTTNWVTLYTTNNPATNSFLVTDPGATNRQRFYRILVGP